MSVVKINAPTVPAEMRETLEQRFASRAGMVDSQDGFEWFELLRPVEGPTSTSCTRAGAARRTSDGGERPKPASTDSALWSFEVVQRTGPKA